MEFRMCDYVTIHSRQVGCDTRVVTQKVGCVAAGMLISAHSPGPSSGREVLEPFGETRYSGHKLHRTVGPKTPTPSLNLHVKLHSVFIHVLFVFSKASQTLVHSKARMFCVSEGSGFMRVQGPRFCAQKPRLCAPSDPASVCPKSSERLKTILINISRF
ncbi:hypothetical protein EVAR_11721_1 [Eumeta japonica]|uniref:Uncharacterized protein n=1 Tax=Eumeta variegata TaxID=151549 RepID=A0A4C1U4K6_EUMVA|nr:hypothetical protein EVAR_11721_1 [Eumeta japonica]